MSKTLLILLFTALCALHVRAQGNFQAQIRGYIIDRDTRQPLVDATVALLHTSDSSRVAATFSGKNGAFILRAQPGPYLLFVTYIGYQQLLKPVTVADTLINEVAIPLQRKGVNLHVVEIVDIRAPMVLKKDTLEFNADYYKTMDHASMEELLKKLPGIEISSDGSLKVNGEPIKKILVDGKPFFGDDPKLALRNLPANLIDRIQLVDQKSDQAQFSRIIEGKTEKAVNITTKKQKQNKLTGRTSVGYGTNERFSINESLSRFGAHSFTVLGSGNNVNGALENVMGTGSNGVIRNWNGGINYSAPVTQTLNISGSYLLNKVNTVSKSISTRQNLLSDTAYLK